MQINNAMQNMMLCHFGEVTTGITGGDYRRVYVQLREGPIPSKSTIDSLWVNVIRTVSGRIPGIILTTLDGYPQFDIPLDTTKRVLRTDRFLESIVVSTGTIGYAIIYISREDGSTYLAYLLTVGYLGSGADMELETLDVVAGDKFKLDNITLDHSFILAGA